MFTRRTPALAPQPPRGLLAGKSIDNPSTNVSPLPSSPAVSEGLRSPRLCRPPGSRRHPVSPPNQLTIRAPDTQRRAGSLKSGWPRTALGSATAGQDGMSAEAARSPPQSSPPADGLPPRGKEKKTEGSSAQAPAPRLRPRTPYTKLP